MLNSGEKKKILTLVLSEKFFLTKRETIIPPPPFQVKWSVPNNRVVSSLNMSNDERT